jgi:hypothetical protein
MIGHADCLMRTEKAQRTQSLLGDQRHAWSGFREAIQTSSHTFLR